MPDDGNQIADDLDLDWSELFPQMRRILGEVATTSSGQLFAALEYTPSDDVFAEVAESTANYAALRAAELIGKKWVDGELVDNPNPAWAISETTRNSLYSLINQALEEGWSASRIRDEVAGNYSFSQARALMIARTERQLAQSRGALVAAKASGVVKAKRSVLSAAHPESSDCDCPDNAEQGFIPIDEEFQSGDDAPPFHPNCSCIIQFSSEEPNGEEDDEGA